MHRVNGRGAFPPHYKSMNCKTILRYHFKVDKIDSVTLNQVVIYNARIIMAVSPQF